MVVTQFKKLKNLIPLSKIQNPFEHPESRISKANVVQRTVWQPHNFGKNRTQYVKFLNNNSIFIEVPTSRQCLMATQSAWDPAKVE